MAARAPLLVVASVSAAAADGVVAVTLFFLVNAAVRLRAELDRREKRKEEKEKQEEHEKPILVVADRLRQDLPVTKAEREAAR